MGAQVGAGIGVAGRVDGERVVEEVFVRTWLLESADHRSSSMAPVLSVLSWMTEAAEG